MSRIPNIHRSRVHEDTVQKLAVDKLNGMERSLFPTIRELLCFAAILGFAKERRVKLERDLGLEDISYQQFERENADDLVFLIALCEEKNPDVLKKGNETRCGEIFEEYANGGLYVISDALARKGGEYPDEDILEMFRRENFVLDDDESKDISDLEF